jgi:hypothetical protein
MASISSRASILYKATGKLQAVQDLPRVARVGRLRRIAGAASTAAMAPLRNMRDSAGQMPHGEGMPGRIDIMLPASPPVEMGANPMPDDGQAALLPIRKRMFT